MHPVDTIKRHHYSAIWKRVLVYFCSSMLWLCNIFFLRSSISLVFKAFTYSDNNFNFLISNVTHWFHICVYFYPYPSVKQAFRQLGNVLTKHACCIPITYQVHDHSQNSVPFEQTKSHWGLPKCSCYSHLSPTACYPLCSHLLCGWVHWELSFWLQIGWHRRLPHVSCAFCTN